MFVSPVENRPDRAAGWWLSLIAALVIVTAVAAGILIKPTYALTGPAPLRAGTRLYDLDLSGVTPAAAIPLVAAFAESVAAEPVRLVTDERDVVVTRADLGWRLDTDRLTAWLGERARGEGTADIGGGQLASLTRVTIDPQRLQAVLTDHFASDGEPPVPAEWSLVDGELHVIPAAPGTQPATAGLALAMLKDPFADTYTVPFGPAWPEVTEATLRATGLDGLRGSYTTYYYVSDEGRARNVELAAEAINGMWLMPGEELSFNAATDAVPDHAWHPRPSSSATNSSPASAAASAKSHPRCTRRRSSPISKSSAAPTIRCPCSIWILASTRPSPAAARI